MSESAQNGAMIIRPSVALRGNASEVNCVIPELKVMIPLLLTCHEYCYNTIKSYLLVIMYNYYRIIVRYRMAYIHKATPTSLMVRVLVQSVVWAYD